MVLLVMIAATLLMDWRQGREVSGAAALLRAHLIFQYSSGRLLLAIITDATPAPVAKSEPNWNVLCNMRVS